MEELFKVTFDAKTEEIEKAYITFQNRFSLRKKIIYTVVYAIVIVLGIDLILKNPSGPAGYIATGLALGILVYNWVKPVLIRKKLVTTLSELNDETYTASFFDDRIEIETVISEDDAETEIVAVTSKGVYKVEEGSDAMKELEENPELLKDETKPEKTVYKLAETEILFEEKDELFLIFVNRAYIHTIPKRCLSDIEQQQLKTYFGDKALTA